MSNEQQPDPIVFRASGMNKGDCDRKYVAQILPANQLALRKTPTNWNSIVGTVVHNIALQPDQFTYEAIASHIQDQINMATKRGLGIIGASHTQNREDAEEQVKRCLLMLHNHPGYHELELGKVGGSLIEYAMKSYREATNSTLSGHCDYYNEEQHFLMDIKCTGTTKIPNPVAQLGAYAYMLEEMGYTPQRLETWVLPIRSLSENASAKKLIVVQHNKDDCVIQYRANRWHAEVLMQHYARTKNLNAIPANSNSWACSPNYCPLYRTEHCTAYPTEEQQQ